MHLAKPKPHFVALHLKQQSFIKSKTPTFFFAIHDDKCMNFHGKVASKNAKPVKMSLVCAKVISCCKVPIWNGSFTAYYTRFFAPYLQIFWNSHHLIVDTCNEGFYNRVTFNFSNFIASWQWFYQMLFPSLCFLDVCLKNRIWSSKMYVQNSFLRNLI